jgi:O-antigen/teichoic acid export membrane protein
LHAESDQELGDFYILVSRIAWVITMPILLMVGAFPEPLFRSLLGAEFSLDKRIVWILLIGLAINIAFGLNTLTLVAAGRRAELAIAGGATFGCALLLGLALIPRYGPIGAGVTTSISFVVQNVVVSGFLLKKVNVSPFRREHVISLLSGTAVIVSLATLAPEMWRSSLLAASLAVVLAWLGWIASLFAVRSLRISELRPVLSRRRHWSG